MSNTLGFNGLKNDFAIGCADCDVRRPLPDKIKFKQEILTELVLCDLRSLSLFSGGMGGDIWIPDLFFHKSTNRIAVL